MFKDGLKKKKKKKKDNHVYMTVYFTRRYDVCMNIQLMIKNHIGIS